VVCLSAFVPVEVTITVGVVSTTVVVLVEVDVTSSGITVDMFIVEMSLSDVVDVDVTMITTAVEGIEYPTVRYWIPGVPVPVLNGQSVRPQRKPIWQQPKLRDAGQG